MSGELPFEHILRAQMIVPGEWTPETAARFAELLEDRDRDLEQFLMAMFMGEPVAWTPVLKQNGSTVTSAVEFARYKLFGQLCWFGLRIYATASGSTGAVSVSTPLPVRANGSPSDHFQPPVGSGYDRTGASCTVYIDTASTNEFLLAGGDTTALSNGESVAMQGWYWLATPAVPSL